MTISRALTIALIVAVFAGATNTNLANNTNLVIILLIALIALAGVTTLSENQSPARTCCRNRIISTTGTVTQTLF